MPQSSTDAVLEIGLVSPGTIGQLVRHGAQATISSRNCTPNHVRGTILCIPEQRAHRHRKNARTLLAHPCREARGGPVCRWLPEASLGDGTRREIVTEVSGCLEMFILLVTSHICHGRE